MHGLISSKMAKLQGKASRFTFPGLKPRAEWREDKGGLGWFLSPLRFSPVSAPEPRHRLEAYATMLSGVSSDLSKCFLRRVPRTHSDHATA